MALGSYGVLRGINFMKRKYSEKKLHVLEKEMKNPSRWESADHTVSYDGPTSIRFRPDMLKKLHALSKAKHKTISRLVSDYVRAFADEEYQLLQVLS